MNYRHGLIASISLLIVSACSLAGTVYRVTSADGKNETTYEVRFGGGRAFEEATAFDPASKKFVYLTWKRGSAMPEPAGSIWDHKTGITTSLYRFPGVAQPLPVIPSIDDLTICPKTGGRILRKEKTILFD